VCRSAWVNEYVDTGRRLLALLMQVSNCVFCMMASLPVLNTVFDVMDNPYEFTPSYDYFVLLAFVFCFEHARRHP